MNEPLFRVILPNGKKTKPYSRERIRAALQAGKLPADAIIQLNNVEMRVDVFCGDTEGESNPPQLTLPPALPRRQPTTDATPTYWWLLLVGVGVIGFLLIAFRSTGKARESAPIIFDITWVHSQSIDEIRKQFGQPKDSEPEPTELQLQLGVDEWNNMFSKDGQDLLITFNPKTRRVIDFFLVGEDETILMQRGHLEEGTPTFRIEPVKQRRDPSRITGIRIIPTGRN